MIVWLLVSFCSISFSSQLTTLCSALSILSKGSFRECLYLLLLYSWSLQENMGDSIWNFILWNIILQTLVWFIVCLTNLLMSLSKHGPYWEILCVEWFKLTGQWWTYIEWSGWWTLSSWSLYFVRTFVNRTIYFCLFTSFFVVSECFHPVVFLNYVYTCIFNLLLCLPCIILIFFYKSAPPCLNCYKSLK